jgi:hypothetical protein
VKHARPDYDRIQDPAGLIPDDEPVFLIRAKDAISPAVVNHWASLAQLAGASPVMVRAARRQADAMKDWQVKHGSKIPDLPVPS